MIWSLDIIEEVTYKHPSIMSLLCGMKNIEKCRKPCIYRVEGNKIIVVGKEVKFEIDFVEQKILPCPVTPVQSDNLENVKKHYFDSSNDDIKGDFIGVSDKFNLTIHGLIRSISITDVDRCIQDVTYKGYGYQKESGSDKGYFYQKCTADNKRKDTYITLEDILKLHMLKYYTPSFEIDKLDIKEHDGIFLYKFLFNDNQSP